MNYEQRTIRRVAEARGIKKLGHFTPFQNVESILTHGLHTRTFLEENDQGIDAYGTDSQRLDGFPHTISMSIEGINSAMLKRKMKEDNCNWAIMEIDAEILWTHTCRFCWDNAACKNVRKYGRLNDAKHFDSMFEDWDHMGSTWRGYFNVPDHRPSRDAAEVMVFGHVPASKILGITVENWACRSALERAMNGNDQLPKVDIEVSSSAFC